MSAGEPLTCPDCGDKGRKVDAITPRSLLTDSAVARWSTDGALRFCESAECDVVYFGASDRFVTADVHVPVFQKSRDPDRLVCYCFDHSVRTLQDEVARDGTSAAPDRIAENCKAGLDHCEKTNPQGSCCLGNVRQVVKAAAGAVQNTETMQGTKTIGESPACCVPEPAGSCATGEGPVVSQDRTSWGEGNIGLWSAAAALGAAVLSSACCWLPLALIGFGASAAGVAGFFAAYRVPFLGLTAVLLGAGFYSVYVRKPRCAPGDACAPPNPKLRRFNRTLLWLATVWVVAFAAFPNYVGSLLGGESAPPPVTAVGTTTRMYHIAGMTCAGCAEHVRETIGAVAGVAGVEVSYDEKTARVDATGAAQDRDIVAAVAAIGYEMIPDAASPAP